MEDVGCYEFFMTVVLLQREVYFRCLSANAAIYCDIIHQGYSDGTSLIFVGLVA